MIQWIALFLQVTHKITKFYLVYFQKEMAAILWIPAAFGLFSIYLYYLSTHLPPISETRNVNA